jgi:hypothetical protein
MNTDMTSTPWLDLENADQRSWALIYLRTHRGAVITEKGLDEWLIQERRKDSAVLARMKRAWGQVQRRKESKRAGEKACSFVLSSKAKRHLDTLAKQNESSIKDFLETLLSDEYEEASQQKIAARDAAKKAAEKEKLLRKKLEAINLALHECITELTQRTIMMETENLSIRDISEEQKSQSATLHSETLKKFTAKRSMLPRDEVFPRGMERPM